MTEHVRRLRAEDRGRPRPPALDHRPCAAWATASSPEPRPTSSSRLGDGDQQVVHGVDEPAGLEGLGEEGRSRRGPSLVEIRSARRVPEVSRTLSTTGLVASRSVAASSRPASRPSRRRSPAGRRRRRRRRPTASAASPDDGLDDPVAVAREHLAHELGAAPRRRRRAGSSPTRAASRRRPARAGSVEVLGDRGEVDLEGRALARAPTTLDGPAALGREALRRGEPHARALEGPLGREERIEAARAGLVVHARRRCR